MLALGVYPEITLADARVRRDETRAVGADQSRIMERNQR